MHRRPEPKRNVRITDMHSLKPSKALLQFSTNFFWVGVATTLLLGCSGSSVSNTNCTTPGGCGTGGAVDNGGNGSTGGVASVGGTSSPGGAASQGGNANTGGLNSTGGMSTAAGGSNTGGLNSTGGMAQSGGKSATGGNVAATGGLAATGGKSATGGLAATGGKSATGGAAPTGGKSSTGGSVSATGGSSATAGGTSTSATCTGTHTNPLSQALIDQFVTAHNNARSGPLNPTPNPPLPPVSWDCILADSAYNYLATCPGGAVSLAPHNANRTTDYAALGGTGYVGENIYATTGSTASPQAAVDSWMSEASAYDYTTNNITAAGHYTQVVWRASIRIGCAIVNCSNYTYHNTILCDYSPGGNITTQKPY